MSHKNANQPATQLRPYSAVKRRHGASRRLQAGFTLIEIAVVAAVLLVAYIVGIPQISALITANKVPPLAADLQRFVASSKIAAQGIGTTPFAGVSNAHLANSLRGSSVVNVSGTGDQAVVSHGIGATDGVITLAPAQITSAGDAYTLTLSKVSEAACPDIAAVMQRVSESITINTIAVKTPGTNGVQGVYAAATAKAACTSGDSNTFVFTAR